MESKVCSRSHGQPPGPRRRAMIETARSKRSPVFGMDETLNEVVRGNKQGMDFGIHRAYKKINLLADPLGEKSSEALPQTVTHSALGRRREFVGSRARDLLTI